MIEEAKREELMESIKHILASEEHMIEILMKNDYSEKLTDNITQQVNLLRVSRQVLLKHLFKLNAEPITDKKTPQAAWWCSIKHLLLAQVHLEECIEKYSDNEDKKMLESLISSLSITHIQINKMLDNFFNLESCKRCDEDTGINIIDILDAAMQKIAIKSKTKKENK